MPKFIFRKNKNFFLCSQNFQLLKTFVTGQLQNMLFSDSQNEIFKNGHKKCPFLSSENSNLKISFFLHFTILFISNISIIIYYKTYLKKIIAQTTK